MPWCKIRCVFGDGCHVNPMIWYSFMVPSQFFTAYPFGVYKSLNSTWPPAASLIVLKPQKDPLKLLIQLRHRSRGPQNLPRCPMDRRNFFAANKVILFVVKGSFFFLRFLICSGHHHFGWSKPWVTPFHSLVKHHDCYMKWPWISWIGGQPSIFTPVWNEFGGDR